MASQRHPRTIGAIGTVALAMGGSNQSLFLLGALLMTQGTAAVPLLVIGLLMSWAALPGWTELILMWPNRVGGIAASCAEAFRPYSPILANLTGVCYWWGWIPTCGLTAILSADALHAWYLPGVPVHLLAASIVLVFTGVNLLGVRCATRLAVPLAFASASLALISTVGPVLTGHVNWHRALDFHLSAPFSGAFGWVTSAMAGLYLVGFAAPAFEAAACHVGETRDPARNVPRAMFGAAGMASIYFIAVPVIWLGVLGPHPLEGTLAQTLGPTFAPLLGGAAKGAAVWFMVMNMFHGTLQPLAGAARTLSQLAEDGLLPVSWTRRNRFDVPWVTTALTAAMAILFLQSGDPTWVIAAANLAYLIGIAMPSVAVWLLRRNEPDRLRPYRAPRGTINLGFLAAIGWLLATVLGFEQFGLPTVIASIALCYGGAALYGWRRWQDRRAAGERAAYFSLQGKLTTAMVAVVSLDGAGYLVAVAHVSKSNPALVTLLQDIFVGVALLTITVGLVLPGIVGHAVEQVATAARRLATGTLAELTRAMQAIGAGDLDAPHHPAEVVLVEVRTHDELAEMAAAFNLMQEEAARASEALQVARDSLRSSEQALARHATQQGVVALLGLRALQVDDVPSIRAEILETARELFGADHLATLEWDAATGSMARGDASGAYGAPAFSPGVAPGDPITEIGPSRRLVVPDWAVAPTASVLHEPGVKATLAVLISERDGRSAILAAQFREPREFSRDEADTLQAIANLLASTTERERSAEEMVWRALHDPLTELPNRVLFVDRLRQAVAACRRSRDSVAVLFLDIDHFKFVNDSLGHSAGDELLRQIADRLREMMRAGDTVARFGGDEFLLICQDVAGPSEARDIAQRVLDVLGEPVLLAGQEHVVGVSVGIAIASDGGRDPEDLIREADAAMYEAKEKGRNGYAVYDEAMRARASQRLSTEHELRRALDNGELRLHYQPVVRLPGRELDGVEALIRWEHPERGLVMPEHFMSIAEQSGLIVPLGSWVLREALDQAAAWRMQFPGRRVPVAVNLSAREVTNRELLETVTGLLSARHLAADLLELEITESVLMDPAETSMDSLGALREMGVRIVLDDFGTGYSSLAYVKHFPIDGLKIDRSFVRDLVAASADASIIEAVIAMAKGLRLGVVAEGVETLEQAELLEDMGCVRCQGFAFSSAVPASEISRLLAREDAVLGGSARLAVN